MTPISLDRDTLELALKSLAIRLADNQSPPIGIVVCGGSALILTGLIPRTTRDVDVVALIRNGKLCSPAPLPAELLKACDEVAEDLGLAKNWLNNGPSKDDGGLFQMGLPAGFAERLHSSSFGPLLSVYFIDRLDQIFFKLYAAVDRGGYHITDLQALAPSPEEIEAAARWTMTHDVSVGFATVLKSLLRNLDYGNVADRL